MNYFVILLIFISSVSNASAIDKLAQKSFDYSLNRHDYKLINLLEKRKYTEIIEYIGLLEKDSFKNPDSELKLDYELNSLGTTQRNYERKLSGFVSRFSSSHIPVMMRAYYYQGKAWQTRGTSFSHEVSKKKLYGMEFFREKALSDINKAVNVNQNSEFSWLLKAQIHILVSSEKDEAVQSFQNALNLLPQSYSVRNILLHNSTPRWGGTLEEMREIIEESKKHYSTNPYLKSLESTILEEQADQAQSKNKEEAIKLYLKAIELGDRDRPRTDIAELLFSNGNTQEACAHLKRAVDLNPPRWRAHELMRFCQAM